MDTMNIRRFNQSALQPVPTQTLPALPVNGRFDFLPSWWPRDKLWIPEEEVSGNLDTEIKCPTSSS